MFLSTTSVICIPVLLTNNAVTLTFLTFLCLRNSRDWSTKKVHGVFVWIFGRNL